MRKNLLSVIILALLVVNIVLTAIMMFSVVGANNKTSQLVGDIATALALDFSDPTQDSSVVDVPVADISTYKCEEQLTITLKDSGDGKDHYFITSVSFSMNTKDKGYKNYGETVANQADLLKSCVYSVVSDFTLDDLRADNNAAAEKEILAQIQDMYDSEFIFKVNFIDFLYQ